MIKNVKKGFSLIELSIVVVIVGLLIAGISAGTKLLKQAELRSIINEMTTHKVAFNTFKSTYKAIPGDFRGATGFFRGCAITESNCDGNGNSNIDAGSGTDDEIGKAFVHLSLAELISKTLPYPIQDAHDGSTFDYAMDSDVDGAKYFFGGKQSLNTRGPFPSPFLNDSQAIYLGRYNFTTLTQTNGAMNATDAFQIDSKLDDGRILVGFGFPIGAGTGVFRAENGEDGLNCKGGSTTYLAFNGDNSEGCVIGLAID